MKDFFSWKFGPKTWVHFTQGSTLYMAKHSKSKEREIFFFSYFENSLFLPRILTHLALGTSHLVPQNATIVPAEGLYWPQVWWWSGNVEDRSPSSPRTLKCLQARHHLNEGFANGKEMFFLEMWFCFSNVERPMGTRTISISSPLENWQGRSEENRIATWSQSYGLGGFEVPWRTWRVESQDSQLLLISY